MICEVQKYKIRLNVNKELLNLCPFNITATQFSSLKQNFSVKKQKGQWSNNSY